MQDVELHTSKWIMIKDAPARLNCSRAIVYKWVKEGKIRNYRPMKELWLYLPDLLDAEKDMRNAELDSV